VNDGRDIVTNVLLLSFFVGKGNGTKVKTIKDSFDVDFKTTRYAYAEIRKA